ncbi:MAG: Inositol 2-dehydrogenase/D-chiro-inositol 3-dehydrogenase [Fimbriimonadales bacterium]|nr:Inositol 2-dehydrogenase/D-chiro-inositol 3-dehydrogenase [Fimbriimonadales bacterium]
MSKKRAITRRDFLQKTAAASTAVYGLGASAFSSAGASSRQASPNDTIVFGLIGCGGMGASNMRSFMGHPDVAVAALCDVDSNRIPGDAKAVQDKYGKAPDIYSDYRRILDRKDIDAVIVGTPDHWHALNLIHACEAGKDSYCEKPISHNIVEAKAMVAAAKKFKRVVQVGTWQRSNREFTDAIDFVRSGKLGRVVLTRAWISDGTRIGKKPPTAPPANLDYNFWIGPAKMVPYQDNKVHWNWRWVMNTGGGLTTDWGVHMIDIALLGMSKGQDLVMPVEIATVGGQWAIRDDDRDAPDTITSICRFTEPDFALEWSVGRDHPSKPGHGTEFVSEDGRTLRVWRGGWTLLDADGNELPKEQAPPAPTDHWRNFLDCVKNRRTPRADLHSVAQTTIVCHLINAALMSGDTVRWDKKKMDIVGGAGKNTMAYSRPYRRPWSLPMHGI